MLPEAKYFPVKSGPYKIRADLFPFGKDFGNPQDNFFFQADLHYEEYIRQKLESPYTCQVINQPDFKNVHNAIIDWMVETLDREQHPISYVRPYNVSTNSDWYEYFGDHIQEDLVVLHKPDNEEDLTIALDVRFPTGWNPITKLGKSFKEIHDPVPDLTKDQKRNDAFVDAIINRGPYVRFVWAIVPGTAKGNLSWHPYIPRQPWDKVSHASFRVERQVTVPFPEVRASLFLIRVYEYPLEELALEQKQLLASVIEATAPAEAQYKDFVDSGKDMIRCLGVSV